MRNFAKFTLIIAVIISTVACAHRHRHHRFTQIDIDIANPAPLPVLVERKMSRAT